VSTQFDAPVGLEPGPNTLVVVANGIASTSVNVAVGSTNVPATDGSARAALCLTLMLLGSSAASGRRHRPHARASETPAQSLRFTAQ
jgi:hypothetical protein